MYILKREFYHSLNSDPICASTFWSMSLLMILNEPNIQIQKQKKEKERKRKKETSERMSGNNTNF